MLRPLSRALLIAALSLSYIAFHGHWNDACAKKHSGGDDDGGGDDDDGGDDDSGGDSGGDKGGGDDSDDDNGDEDPKDQPAVTSGGLFTLKTYPVNEIARPLTMTQGIAQVRVGLGTDISAKGAFGTGGLSVEGVYGYSDNFELIGGFTNAYNMRAYSAYFGFEGALAYDLLDIRVAADLHRSAIPLYSNYCTPVTATDMQNPTDPTMCGAGDMASIVNLPNGNYHAGDAQFSIDLGFPLRYAIKPQIAIVALQTLMRIDFNSVERDHVLPGTQTVNYTDSMGMLQTETLTTYAPVGNKSKPDLIPSIGIATNPIPQLSLVILAQLIIPDFDTSAGAFQVPVTARIEASPSQQFDIGLAFTLLNVKPPDPQSPIDNRFISAYVQARFGK
jgi:hypothetical protein